jgi:hypothetical protein
MPSIACHWEYRIRKREFLSLRAKECTEDPVRDVFEPIGEARSVGNFLRILAVALEVGP